MRIIRTLISRLLPALALLTSVSASAADNPRVELKTTMGSILIELDAQAAPKSVANFLQYVNDGFYNGTIFHRVIDGFMIQGGGFTAEMDQKETREPIENEAANGLKNMKGTIAMARTGEPHSATAQFFINVADNDFLNHTAPTPDGWGYAVFGKVVEGMEVVDKIRQTPTQQVGPFEGVPATPVVIESAAVVAAEQAAPAESTAPAPTEAPVTEEAPQ
jgi:cyclophilin family peptidyl-prolyl cis-trans isomerase